MRRRFAPPHPFPAATLRRLEGGECALSGLWRDASALFVVGHSDCLTTRTTLPAVDRLARSKSAPGALTFVLQDTEEAARALARDLDLRAPILLEADPYPLASALALRTVPTTMLVGRDGAIEWALEGFRKDELESLAVRLGCPPPLFAPDDPAPPRRPG